MGMEQDTGGETGRNDVIPDLREVMAWIDANAPDSETSAHVEQVTHDEGTLRRATASLVSSGLTEAGANEAINQLLNDGLLIRDRATCAGLAPADTPRCQVPSTQVAGAWYQCWCGARWRCVKSSDGTKPKWRRERPHSEEVTISADQLRRFVRDSEELGALESAGVDNWEGHESVDWENVEDLIDHRIARFLR